MKIALAYNQKPESNAVTGEFLSQDIHDKYAEWDSFETIDAVRKALSEQHSVILVEADENAFDKFRQLKPEIVFNIAEGMHGISREAQIPAMLDMLNIPYTGSDPLTLSTCLDKSRAKEILSYHKIKTPAFELLNSPDELNGHLTDYPMIVKPIAEGSSKGIFSSSLVHDFAALKKQVCHCIETYKQPCLIEEYLPGREFTVALIGNGHDLEVLPIVEINFSSLPSDVPKIYSYEAKWILDNKDNPLDIFSCPAHLDVNLQAKIEETVRNAYRVLRLRDWSRIDIRLDGSGEPNIIEINPLPGILPDPGDNSCFPKAARAKGYSYSEMINKVLNAAAKRHGLI